jgi:hypothetical protein
MTPNGMKSSMCVPMNLQPWLCGVLRHVKQVVSRACAAHAVENPKAAIDERQDGMRKCAGFSVCFALLMEEPIA